MLEISEKEWATLRVADNTNYVASVRADIVREYPVLADDATLSDRLNTAYAKARELGFVHAGPIHDFLELEANAPGFYDKPAVSALLHQKNVSAEGAFEMMLNVMRWQRRQTGGKN
ncbi:hypothetical protein [Paraburkholderia metrosideri]|uniref:Uncharacterized protein n=1 Tax=Paraburkholderia metrosideri TaxID=580937 RepID=A0ABM8NDC6_9BURK|nr:hypothetical protein [Paraburkholderia metrosideri]CAD6518344.1 hypothetical protein LMG28140_01078 [Paraburkholderia metrosideri]